MNVVPVVIAPGRSARPATPAELRWTWYVIVALPGADVQEIETDAGDSAVATTPAGADGAVHEPFASNVAPTDVSPFIVTVQSPVPSHAPLQREKLEPDDAVAVNVTSLPRVTLAVHF